MPSIFLPLLLGKAISHPVTDILSIYRVIEEGFSRYLRYERRVLVIGIVHFEKRVVIVPNLLLGMFVVFEDD